MRVGIGIGLNYQRPSFNPAALFSVAGSRGFFYDFSDYSTQFTDTAGTTAITGVGQSLGMVLDKSAGPSLGPELIANPGGPFTATTGWTVSGGTLSVVSGALVVTSSGAGTVYITADFANVGNRSYRCSATYSGSGANLNAYRSGPFTNFMFNMPSGQSIVGLSTDTDATASVTLFFTATGAGQTATLNNISVRELPGFHATQATAGSRPLTTTIGTGFRGIQFDGVDDFLQTAAIDFSNSDKMTVVAGVRKLSDAATGTVVELSANPDTTNGSFAMRAPSGANSYVFRAFGTVGPVAVPLTGFAAPESAVITGLGDISADSTAIRRNGAAGASLGTDLGTGNYSNSPVFIGRGFGGTANPLNGILTFLCVINRTLTAAELAQLEAFANSRTGAY